MNNSHCALNFAPGPRTESISILCPGTHQDSRPRKIAEHADHLLAQKFEVVLAVIVTLARGTIFAKNHQV